jgi:hypothetical protein
MNEFWYQLKPNKKETMQEALDRELSKAIKHYTNKYREPDYIVTRYPLTTDLLEVVNRTSMLKNCFALGFEETNNENI